MQVNKIKGYENVLDCYKVYGDGKVMNEERSSVLKAHDNGKGYLVVSMKVANERKWKKAYLHRLVALAYLPIPPEDLIEVNHIDQNKRNNKLDNLEWTDRLGNVRHADGIKRGVAKRAPLIYVYDYKLNFIGKFVGMNQATISTLGCSRTNLINKRSKEYFYFTEPLNKHNLMSAVKESAQKTVVLENINTHEKRLFPNNRALRDFFDNKVNVTDAIKHKWTVRNQYKIYPYDYSESKVIPT